MNKIKRNKEEEMCCVFRKVEILVLDAQLLMT